MGVSEIKQIISGYKEDDEIALCVSGIRITGLLINHDDYSVKIKLDTKSELINICYMDIEGIEI